jgi:hypothetical protein
MFRVKIQRLHLFTDDEETFVAYDELDALRVAALSRRHSLEDELKHNDGIIYEQIKDTVKIPVLIEEEEDRLQCSRMPFTKIEDKGQGLYLVTAPAWVWALFNGRGFLSSTEF